MLRTNLSTRPFYNARAVRAALLALALVAAGLTIYNAGRIIALLSSQSTLGASQAEARREAARLRSEAVRIRSQIDRDELAVVAAAAREANTLIDQRAFSWTDLMTQFETTLPEDVRIRVVQPRLERGQFVVSIVAEAQSPEDIDAFIEALEQSGNFRDVLPAVQSASDEGLIAATIQGVYLAGPKGGAARTPDVEAPR
jgi:hypothetical protein